MSVPDDTAAWRPRRDCGRSMRTAEGPSGAVDLAVVAVPPGQVTPVVASHRSRGAARSSVDVAGVKVSRWREREVLGCDLAPVVGGHPRVGRPGAGSLTAQDDLRKAT
ncbi:prephenate dehydrogenase/arogenate dehydrogenase family protein [Streptomyces rishiriensis]|uniref:prephenate dehydrogenase/arogenate dehydrogenase family protein n=1 Tax=Streptomyces rishiriensis TaxID=68264 RepID=UPI000D590EB1